uniref:hypothetical protein n=1 Tax=Streptosporangium sp. CA-235898 TaxID=3240073 RepID=UPI003F4912FE
MAWTNEDGHDGWDAAEFPGNRFSVGSRGGGATVRHFPPGPGRLPAAQGEPEEVDGRTAIGWRGLCECGWRGALWERVATRAEHDAASRRIYDPDPSPYGDAPREVEDALHAEWNGHLEPETLTAVRIEAEAANAAQARLTEAVRAARRDGRSWTDIGSAVGTSRQAAHERWGTER